MGKIGARGSAPEVLACHGASAGVRGRPARAHTATDARRARAERTRASRHTARHPLLPLMLLGLRACRHVVRRSAPARGVWWSGLNPLSWRSGLGGEPGMGRVPAEPDGRDEAAKHAILEKLMQGRQPAELMLRCMSVRANVFTRR
jgi:hypothetical protein